MATKAPAKKKKAPAKKAAAKKAPPRKRTSRRVTPKTKELKLDIACGQHKEEGFVGIDIADIEGVDIVHDLNVRPWPLEDNSVDEARCIHYIEHVVDQIGFMNELYRVLKPGATCLIIAPYYTSIRAWQDPTHVRAISENCFYYYNQDWLRQEGLDHTVSPFTGERITADFNFNWGFIFHPNYANRADEVRQAALVHQVNVANDIVVTAIKK